MSQTFYDHEVLGPVEETNRSYWNGYALLFDIKNSTGRKREESGRWYSQTDAFYQGITALSRNLQRLMTDGLRARFFSGLQQDDRRAVVKFGGDSGFVFVPRSYGSSQREDEAADPELSQEIVKLALAFRDDTHSTKALGGIRLKSVVTYLTKVRPWRPTIPDSNLGVPNLDVLARGIDFTFRLEVFADETHLVVNEMLHDSLMRLTGSQAADPLQEHSYDSVNIVGGEKHNFLECHKSIRGWQGPQRFYLLVGESLDETLQPNVSQDRRDVEAELFKFHLATKRRTQRANSADQQTALEDLVSEKQPMKSPSTKTTEG